MGEPRLRLPIDIFFIAANSLACANFFENFADRSSREIGCYGIRILNFFDVIVGLFCLVALSPSIFIGKNSSNLASTSLLAVRNALISEKEREILIALGRGLKNVWKRAERSPVKYKKNSNICTNNIQLLSPGSNDIDLLEESINSNKIYQICWLIGGRGQANNCVVSLLTKIEQGEAPTIHISALDGDGNYSLIPIFQCG
jgi:hypothetical protein